MALSIIDLEDILLSEQHDILVQISTGLGIQTSTSTRKLGLVTGILDHLGRAAERDPEAAPGLIGQVQDLLDQARHDRTLLANASTLLPDPPTTKEDGPDNLTALLQNLSTTPASTSLYRRLFKIAGTIGGRDSLSYLSICSQVKDAKQSGYSDQEITIGIKRAIATGTTLRTYFDTKSDLSLEAILSFLRDFFKQRSASDLFHELSSISQDSGETPTNFLLRALELRQRVLEATGVESHQFDDRLVYATFCRSVMTGIRAESVRAHMAKFLVPSREPVGDEVLLREMNAAASMSEEAELKHRKTKTSVHAVSFEEDSLKKLVQPLMDNMAALTKQVQDLQQSGQQSQATGGHSSSSGYGPGRRQGGAGDRQKRRPRCQACTTAREESCPHCFICGSDTHYSPECNDRRGYKPRHDRSSHRGFNNRGSQAGNE